jgi:hypothetical protein
MAVNVKQTLFYGAVQLSSSSMAVNVKQTILSHVSSPNFNSRPCCEKLVHGKIQSVLMWCHY